MFFSIKLVLWTAVLTAAYMVSLLWFITPGSTPQRLWLTLKLGWATEREEAVKVFSGYYSVMLLLVLFTVWIL